MEQQESRGRVPPAIENGIQAESEKTTVGLVGMHDIKHTSLTCLYIKDTEKHRTKQQQIP